MAEFTYTPTQAVVSPTSQRLDARVNTSNAFNQLSEIFNQFQKAKSQEIAGEISMINTQRAEAAREASIAKAEAKAKKDEQELIDKNDARNIKTQASFLSRNFEKDMADPAVENKQQLFSDYMGSLDALVAEANPTVYDKTFDSLKSYREKYNSQYIDYAKATAKENATLELRSSIPSFTEGSLDQQKQDFNDYRDLAIASGYTRQEFGDFWTKSVSDYVVSQLRIAEEDLQNDYGYAQIDSAYNSLKALETIDPRLVDKQVVLDARARIDDIKNTLDTTLKSNFNIAVAEAQQEDFKRLAALGLQQEAFGEDFVNLKAKELAANYVSSGKMARDNAGSIMKTTGGLIAVDTITDSKTKTLVTNEVRAKLIRMLNQQEQVDVNFIRTSAALNKSLFDDVFGKTVNRTIELAVTQAANSKDGNGDAIIASAITQANQLSQYAGYVVPKATRVKMAVAETLTVSGKVANIKDALRVLGNPDEFTPYSVQESNVAKLQKELPIDQFEEARTVYSVLVKSGQMTPEEAFEVAETTYTFDSYDDIDFKMSGKAAQYLETIGVTPNKFKYLNEILTDDTVEVLPVEERDVINKIMLGENPRIQVEGNNLYFSNNDNESYLLQLNPQQKAIVKDSVNFLYDIDNEAMGIQRVADDLMTVVAKDASRAYEIVEGFTVGVAAPFLFAGTAITPDFTVIGDAIGGYTSDVNRTIDKVYTGQIDGGEAIAEVMGAYFKFNATFGDAWGKGPDPDGWEEFQGRMGQLNESLKALPFDEAVKFLGDRMEETLNFIVPSAEASGLQETPLESELLDALAQREAPKRNGVPDLTEGLIHQGQEEGDAPTTNYGVRIDKFPKLENESDREHALRYFNQEFRPFLDKLDIKGVDPMQFAAMTWNTGITNSPLKSLNGLDLRKPEHQARAFQNITQYIHTSEGGGKVWSKGLVNARLADWNNIADVVNPAKKVVSYRAIKDSEGQTFFFYRLADGSGETQLTNKPLSSTSKIKYNTDIPVK